MIRICVILILISIKTYSQCDKKICLEYIKIIESNGDSLAYNKTDGGSRGLYQIAPSCLKEFNKRNHKNYTLNQLFRVKVNTEIATWMVEVEIPYLLKKCCLPNTLENQIITYNAGIGFLFYKKKIPSTTLSYIEKYKKLLKGEKIYP